MIDIFMNRIAYVLAGCGISAAIGLFYPHWILSTILFASGAAFGVLAFFDDLEFSHCLKERYIAPSIIKNA
jgi:hypothetical protein